VRRQGLEKGLASSPLVHGGTRSHSASMVDPARLAAVRNKSEIRSLTPQS
jgi:hypothetical protein